MPTLLTLPAEIRNHIWEYATQAEGNIRLLPRRPPPAITQVNRQIRNETRTMYFAFNTFEASSTFIAIRWLLSVGKEACGSIDDLIIEGPLWSHIRAVNGMPYRLDSCGKWFHKRMNNDFEFLGWHPALRELRVTACRLSDPHLASREVPTAAQRTYHHSIMQRARDCSQRGIKALILAWLASNFEPLQLLAHAKETRLWKLVLHFEEQWAGFLLWTLRMALWKLVGLLFLTLGMAVLLEPAVATIYYIKLCLSFMR